MRVNIEFINKRVMRITHDNGRIIAELLVHGALSRVMDNCDTEAPIVKGTASIFRGELFQLAGYELLDIENECIREKE
jgi:hypothetical protein